MSVEEFAGREKAYEIINAAIDLYQKTFMSTEDILYEAQKTTKKKEEKEEEKANEPICVRSVSENVKW